MWRRRDAPSPPFARAESLFHRLARRSANGLGNRRFQVVDNEETSGQREDSAGSDDMSAGDGEPRQAADFLRRIRGMARTRLDELATEIGFDR